MRTPRMLPVVALVVIALGGCTLVAPDSAPKAFVEAEPYSIDLATVAEVLGPVPEGEPMTAERTADFIQRFQDYRWELVTQTYPDAVRPAVTVTETTGTDVAACTSDGGMSEDVALSDYVCYAQNPSVPDAMLTHDQAGYLYDYWTIFVIPCYHGNGYDGETSSPTRSDFVADWPFHTWSPRPTSLGGEEAIDAFAELDVLCPTVPDELK